MTTETATRRRRRAIMLMAVAGGLIALAAVTLGIEARSSRPDLAVGPVVPNLRETIGRAQRITVTSADASYRIENTQRGWAMRDRGDYPVEAGPLRQLREGLQNLQYLRRMTSDPSKYDRLGVGDPRQGGRGILVQIEDGNRALLVDLILGVETSGLYVRKPGEAQAWAVRVAPGAGELPPLRNVAAWLNLRPLTLQPSDISRVEIAPQAGAAYILARPTQDAATFDLVSPARAAQTASASATAEQITQLQPIDVQPAPSIQGTPRARIRALTYNGLAIEGELIDSDNKTWLKLVARAVDPTHERDALTINDRTAAWAYALSAEDAHALAPPLSGLLPEEPRPTSTTSTTEPTP